MVFRWNIRIEIDSHEVGPIFNLVHNPDPLVRFHVHTAAVFDDDELFFTVDHVLKLDFLRIATLILEGKLLGLNLKLS